MDRPVSELPHTYMGSHGIFTAKRSEMAAWYAKSWWWRIRHRRQAPWHCQHQDVEWPMNAVRGRAAVIGTCRTCGHVVVDDVDGGD